MTRYALITGATRGIGRAIADELAPDFHLYIGGRSPEACAERAASYPRATPWPVDLADADALARAADHIRALDVLIHSAGLWMPGRALEAERDEWRALFEVNVFAPVQLTAALLPALRARRGQVITINSGAGYRSGAGGGAYAATKFALRAYTDALRAEEREAIRVTSIHPGRVDTDMQVDIHDRGAGPHAGRNYDGSRYVDPRSVAAACRFAIDAGEDAMIESVEVRPRYGR